MPVKIKYCDNGRFRYEPLWWHKRGLQQTVSGYGSKLTTPYKTEFPRFEGRWYRVYVIQYSNAGSAYIIVQGERLFLRHETITLEGDQNGTGIH